MFTHTIFQSKQGPDSKVKLDLLYQTFLVEKKLHTLRQFKSKLTDTYKREFELPALPFKYFSYSSSYLFL